ncbi:MAG: FKBP-type peptidyl-prolyl cis-trans isomerase [Bacteroidota bacterium]|jgi:FKBP-type peptidyl-prolyl cis-trans isomerase FkpA|nr:FKBP-type peptidyl-prolyl cis-trans isomerase [Bacteroidota bacterium]MCA6443404.1 FKBP-type peptidyl-prolyl cis-trans isomerase [Bacteroidota bacterium]
MHSFQLISLLICFIFVSCGENPKSSQKPVVTEFDQTKIKNQFVEANKQLLKKENDEIDYYVKTHTDVYKSTNSGIRFSISKSSVKGDSIRMNTLVSINYTLSLLTGDVCYFSQPSEPKQLVVGNDEAESGLHRGLQFFKKGDKGKLIIPSYLAHGLLGDFKKIPPQMPIIYEIEILPN